jgi:hypothetical protein
MLPQTQEEGVVAHTARLASQLFLWPENVLHICSYWLSQYATYTLHNNEKECFNEMITGLLQKQPRLYLCQYQGVTQQLYNVLRCQGIIQFAGTETHRLPLEHLARGQMPAFFESLAQLVRPEAECFLTRNTDGLDGELELNSFLHNGVLETIVEPSFLVLTCYLIHLHALHDTTCSETTSDWLPRHTYSLRAINEEARALIPPGHDVEKWSRTRRDLERLHALLNTTEFEKASVGIRGMWEEKASYCYGEIMSRCTKLNLSS